MYTLEGVVKPFEMVKAPFKLNFNQRRHSKCAPEDYSKVKIGSIKEHSSTSCKTAEVNLTITKYSHNNTHLLCLVVVWHIQKALTHSHWGAFFQLIKVRTVFKQTLFFNHGQRVADIKDEDRYWLATWKHFLLFSSKHVPRVSAEMNINFTHSSHM